MACDNCAQLREQLERQQLGVDELLNDLKNAEVALRVERRKVSQLKAELLEQQKKRAERADAQVVFDYWNQALKGGRCKTMAGKREKVVMDRLAEGYEIIDLIEAIDGARIDAFRKDGKTFNELELICRDATNVDRFREAYAIYEARVQDAVETMVWGQPVPWSPTPGERLVAEMGC